MPLINKTKPGVLSRLFNKSKPQPSSPASMGEKTIGENGDVLEAQETAARGNGVFASRRGARSEKARVDDIIDVESVDSAKSAASKPIASEPVVSEPAAQQPAAPAVSPRNSLEGMFKSRGGAGKPAALKEEPVLDADTLSPADNDLPKAPAAKSKGLFSKKDVTPAAAPEKKKKTKPLKQPGKSSGGAKSLALLTELGDSGKQLLWSLGPNSLSQIPASPAPAEVISFSKEDIRFHTDAPMTYSKAQDMAIEEVGEMVAVVNRTRDLGAVFCTREERATSSPYRIAPGQQALDLLLKKTGREGQSLVTGFSLKDESGTSSVVVLYYVSTDGESSKPQVTVNPDNMDFVLSQFTSSRKINRKETEVVLYNNQDLLSVAGDIKFFADEKVWKGIPVRVLQKAGAGVTGLIAAGAIGWAAMGFTQKQETVMQAAKVQATAKSLTDKNNQVIASSLQSFAFNLSQDQSRMFSLAQQVWVPTSKVIAEMNSVETKITVVLPLVSGVTFNNGPSANSVVNPLRVQQLYDKVAPEGCTKSQPKTTGNLNEIRIDIVCQSLDTPFHRYRGD